MQPPSPEDRERAIARVILDAREGVSDETLTRVALWVLFPHQETAEEFLRQLDADRFLSQR